MPKRWGRIDLTSRYLAVLGIGIVCFAISLFVLRIPIRTIVILFTIGIPIVILWIYAEEKSIKQKILSKISIMNCMCLICKHDEAKQCLNAKCACCIIMNGSIIVDHIQNTEKLT